jgi:hypothetical protein
MKSRVHRARFRLAGLLSGRAVDAEGGSAGDD